jgi:hypothetical protein
MAKDALERVGQGMEQLKGEGGQELAEVAELAELGGERRVLPPALAGCSWAPGAAGRRRNSSPPCLAPPPP